MNKKIKEGNCALCDNYGKLSFEHVPPKSAFNDKPIYIQKHEHLFESSSYVYGKRIISNKGFGGYTLCESCNKNTGIWYAKDFCDFAQQGMKIIMGLEKPQYVIKGVYTIKPLNIIKQILTMFMSADNSNYLKSQKQIVKFILNKESNGMPFPFKVFLYSTLSPYKRKMGYSVVWDENLGTQKWSEINYEPFGYLLTEDSKPAHKDMCDISRFAEYNYNEIKRIEITTPYLKVNSPMIGMYE